MSITKHTPCSACISMSPHSPPGPSQSTTQAFRSPEPPQPVPSQSFVFTSSRYMGSGKGRAVPGPSRPALPEHLRRIHAGQAYNLHPSPLPSGAAPSTSIDLSPPITSSSHREMDRSDRSRVQSERQEQTFKGRTRTHTSHMQHDICPSARFVLPFSIHTSIPLKPTKYHGSSSKPSPLPTPSRSHTTLPPIPSPRFETDISLTEIFSGSSSYFASGVYDNLPMSTASSSNVLESFNKKAMALTETPIDLKLPDPLAKKLDSLSDKNDSGSIEYIVTDTSVT